MAQDINKLEFTSCSLPGTNAFLQESLMLLKSNSFFSPDC